MKDNTEAVKQLNEAADEYAEDLINSNSAEPHEKTWVSSIYLQGALSPQAANGCNKHVEKAKIDSQINIIKVFFTRCGKRFDTETMIELNKIISELTKQRKQYED